LINTKLFNQLKITILFGTIHVDQQCFRFKNIILLLSVYREYNTYWSITHIDFLGASWLWSYGSWIYNYLCQSPWKLWVQILLMAKCTRYNIILNSKCRLWYLMPLSTIFQLYIVAVSFIGGGNRISQKPPTCRKSLTNFIT
jgi:hypothetical protein